jgi:transposase
VNLARTLLFACALAQRIVSFRREGEEHVKESRFFPCVLARGERRLNVTVIYRRCAGMDVHQKSISVCARIRTARDRFRTETAVFGTFTQDLEKMARWLTERKIRHVAMESTGVYWKPVWNVLEARKAKFEMVLVNAQHIKALPGRKTDQQDTERIATYLQEELLRGSFVPPQPVRELRELTRRRTHLQGDRNRAISRIIRLLETANIKRSSVLSDVVGQSGRAILNAIVSGQTAAGDLAAYASSRVKHSRAEFEPALEGRYSDHLRWLLGQSLEDLDHIDRRVALVDLRIGQLTQAHTDLIARLCTLPGVDIITRRASLPRSVPT